MPLCRGFVGRVAGGDGAIGRYHQGQVGLWRRFLQSQRHCEYICLVNGKINESIYRDTIVTL